MVAGKNSSSGRALSALVDDLQAGGATPSTGARLSMLFEWIS